MATSAMFPHAPARKGMYESFYLRAVSPREPVGVWIRHTVQKPAGPSAARLGLVHGVRRRARRPVHAQALERVVRAPSEPGGAWIEIGADERSAGAVMGAGARAAAAGPPRGRCDRSRWRAELRHLSPEWLYRAPLPRTKLTSPAPAALFDGELRAGRRARARAVRAGPAWSATTGAPSTPSAGSGCTAWASSRSRAHGSTSRSVA